MGPVAGARDRVRECRRARRRAERRPCAHHSWFVVLGCIGACGDDGQVAGDAATIDASPDATQTNDNYCTSFDVAEAELSEGGRWAHAATSWQHVRTVNGRALPAAYTEIYDDAYAQLAAWNGGNDYDVIATVYYGGVAAEAEILLRVTDSATEVRAYEFLYNTGGSWQFVRWNGALGDFTPLDGGGTPGNGDGVQTRAKIVGDAITLYWRANASATWTELRTIHDSVHASGKPGLAFYAHAVDQNLDKVGFSDWCVAKP